ncbi:MAG: maltotransferase domain-containing protein [candidate division KSB1 bacterium]|nr:maltotransferase domain-containing protein [candidate division KSB1 bacterium]
MALKGRKRIVIEHVRPEINAGRFPAKRVAGEEITVQADVFGDGHDVARAALLFRFQDEKEWQKILMQPEINDRWHASFPLNRIGRYYYTIQGWIDHFATWKRGFEKKYEVGQDVAVELMIAARLTEEAAGRAQDADSQQLKEYARALHDQNRDTAANMALDEPLEELMLRYPDPELLYTFERELRVDVDPRHALFSAWYELFPRSFGENPGEPGTFRSCERMIPRIADMGFDVIYFPPIHPIGETNRKGRNNSPTSEPGEPGSPWAIGCREGGHTSVHPDLGSIEDFEHFVQAAEQRHIKVALDMAFQCSPDHPWVNEHPEWFHWRPDGTVQHAENPPKKYEDVLPLNFETEQWRELWDALKEVFLFWIEKGVTIFRVDNPHTKPLPFWEWVIEEVKKVEPEAVFLAEAFTRPRVKYGLAKMGFSQSYTYFTWRYTKQQFMDYLTELTRGEIREYCRRTFGPIHRISCPNIYSSVDVLCL